MSSYFEDKINRPISINWKRVFMEGDNYTAAGKNFYEQDNYKYYFPNTYYSAKTIDMRMGNDLFYGRIDTRGNAVVPLPAALKQLIFNKNNPTGKQAYAINFVAEAFGSLQTYLLNSPMKRKLKGGPWADLVPKNSLVSHKRLFEDHMRDLYRLFFYQYQGTAAIKADILNFGDFMRHFMGHFVDGLARNMPITRSAFALSNLCSPLISGLMIEIATESHDDNYSKWEYYIKDPSFFAFREAAAKFGFMIDMNAPWRLVANLSSNAMQNYMNAYQVQADTVFNKYYTRLYFSDIAALRSSMMALYKKLVKDEPEVYGEKSITCDTRHDLSRNFVYTGKVIDTLLSREPLDARNLDTLFDLDYWLTVYFNLRIKEERIQLTTQEASHEVEKIIVMNKYVDLSTALSYISSYIAQKVLAGEAEGFGGIISDKIGAPKGAATFGTTGGTTGQGAVVGTYGTSGGY